MLLRKKEEEKKKQLKCNGYFNNMQPSDLPFIYCDLDTTHSNQIFSQDTRINNDVPSNYDWLQK